MKRRIFCVLFVLALVLCACTQSAAMTWQEQYDLGVRYLSEGNYREAIIAFTAAIEIDPKQADAYVGRGQAYVLSGETEENLAAALADFEAAIELDGTLAEAWLGLADVYIRRGEYDRALEILQEALEKTGNDPSVAGKLAEMESGNIKDSSGNIRRMSRYDGSGVLQWYHEFTYSADGKQASVTHRDAEGNQLGHIDFVYDENGNPLVSYSQYIEDGRLIKTEIEYDDSGRVSKETHYFDEENNDWDCITFQYDANGNIIREDVYQSDGTLSVYDLFEYDSNGNPAKISYYGPDGDLWYYYTYEYNSDGKMVRLNFYDRYYDPENWEYTEDWVLSRYEIHRYNEQGEMIGIDSYDGDGNLQYSETYG